ncbi:gp21 [Listeria phage P40]|uniref:gp21 n=1 Tax=Listeria phage P40 TaxID=560178 RepID=UPI00018198DB|nr:gp21 [Listeria phage P40]ACI00381.1 gp21 [Listeria phage P40]
MRNKYWIRFTEQRFLDPTVVMHIFIYAETKEEAIKIFEEKNKNSKLVRHMIDIENIDNKNGEK